MNHIHQEKTPSQQPNPLLQHWEASFEMPPFDRIHAEHFVPAFESAMARHRVELQAIGDKALKPDFKNTVLALEQSGESLQRVINVFYNLTASHTSNELQAVERDMAPRLAAHFNQMML
ncbi:MAG: dipeptidyl carboxypeptidase II, partial [Burkholderiaceae bacterium]